MGAGGGSIQQHTAASTVSRRQPLSDSKDRWEAREAGWWGRGSRGQMAIEGGRTSVQSYGFIPRVTGTHHEIKQGSHF